VEEGDPADVVLSTADLRSADVIVVGSKGMSSPSRFLVGSVPNKISHHAPCDVIIVHTVP
jgi:nucleotide-binding universal stress UspA family protein